MELPAHNDYIARLLLSGSFFVRKQPPAPKGLKNVGLGLVWLMKSTYHTHDEKVRTPSSNKHPEDAGKSLDSK